MSPGRIAVSIGLVFAVGLSHAVAQESVKVSIKLFQFQPKAIEIRKGMTVMWENGDAIDHSVTAGEPGKQSTKFDSGFFNKDGRFEHIFETTGTYSYFCRRHPNMRGEVRVAE